MIFGKSKSSLYSRQNLSIIKNKKGNSLKVAVLNAGFVRGSSSRNGVINREFNDQLFLKSNVKYDITYIKYTKTTSNNIDQKLNNNIESNINNKSKSVRECFDTDANKFELEIVNSLYKGCKNIINKFNLENITLSLPELKFISPNPIPAEHLELLNKSKSMAFNYAKDVDRIKSSIQGRVNLCTPSEKEVISNFNPQDYILMKRTKLEFCESSSLDLYNISFLPPTQFFVLLKIGSVMCILYNIYSMQPILFKLYFFNFPLIKIKFIYTSIFEPLKLTVFFSSFLLFIQSIPYNYINSVENLSVDLSSMYSVVSDFIGSNGK